MGDDSIIPAHRTEALVLDQVLYSCRDVAKLVGKTEDCVRKWCQAGEIHALKISNAWKIPLVTVRALADGIKLRTEDITWTPAQVDATPGPQLRSVK